MTADFRQLLEDFIKYADTGFYFRTQVDVYVTNLLGSVFKGFNNLVEQFMHTHTRGCHCGYYGHAEHLAE